MDIQEATTLIQSIGKLTDRELLTKTEWAAVHERHATADLIMLLMELDARRLYLGEGCSSLFTYCTQVLHLSEHAAYRRIDAARVALRFPTVLDRLHAGKINLTGIGLLAAHLTAENHGELLDAASHKSKREIEQIVATLDPHPDVASSVRKLPQPRDVSFKVTALSKASDMKQLAPERYKIQFTVDRDTYEQLRYVQDLLRHSNPDGDVAVIFERALSLLLADISKRRLAVVQRPRSQAAKQTDSRHIPAAVKREVWQRDGRRCAFSGPQGRCTETGFLEFHHVVPFAEGGKTTADNLELRCRAHNVYESERWFGPVVQQPSVVRERREVYG